VALTAAAIHAVTRRWSGSHLGGVVAGATFVTTPWVLWTWMSTAPNYAVVFYLPFIMLLAATPLANFINANPTVVMLALGFLLMIGAVLIADGFGVHVPKGYIYAAMAFSALVEGLNMAGRASSQKKQAALDAKQAELNARETAGPGV